MSISAIIVTQYVCEYGGSYFGDCKLELTKLLDDIGVDGWYGDDEGYANDVSIWELKGESIPKIHEYVAKINSLPPNAVNEYFVNRGVRYATNAYVISALETWIANCDQKDNVIRIHWR